MSRCKYKVLLIANDKLKKLENVSDDNFQEGQELSRAWQSICEAGRSNLAIQSRGWDIINYLGEPFTKDKHSTPYVRRFKQDGTNNLFFILEDHEPQGLPDIHIDYLCNLWELEHGLLPVHAAGIIHKGSLFLFSGRSGAGKSTIASISQKMGDQIIDEDQVFGPLIG